MGAVRGRTLFCGGWSRIRDRDDDRLLRDAGRSLGRLDRKANGRAAGHKGRRSAGRDGAGALAGRASSKRRAWCTALPVALPWPAAHVRARAITSWLLGFATAVVPDRPPVLDRATAQRIRRRARTRQPDAGRAASRARRAICPGCARAIPRGPPAQVRHRYGPYDVVGTLGSTDVGELLVAFDPSLRRHVWIHTLPPGAAAVAPLDPRSQPAGPLALAERTTLHERGLGRLRSLGRRAARHRARRAAPWRMVRPWLLDLAREIDAGLKDGSIAALTIDHVWITRDGYAKLLDFRAPGVPPVAHQEEARHPGIGADVSRVRRTERPRRIVGDESGATAAGSRSAAALRIGHARDAGAARLYHMVGDGHPDGRTAAGPRPRGARPPRRAARSLRSCARYAWLLMHTGDLLPHQCRAAHHAGRDGAERRPDPPVELSRRTPAGARTGAGRPRGVYRRSISIDDYRSTTCGRRLPLRRFLNPGDPSPSGSWPTTRPSPPDDMATATAALGPFLRAQERRRDLSVFDRPWMLMLVTLGVSLTLIALFGIVWAFVLRGGLLLRACGIAVVTGDGKPASRLRALWRGLVAWGLVAAAFWLGIGVGIGSRCQRGRAVSCGRGPGRLCIRRADCRIGSPARGSCRE